jgi:hypothetical protein
MYPTALSFASSADPLLDSGLVALRTSGSFLSAESVSSMGCLYFESVIVPPPGAQHDRVGAVRLRREPRLE